MGLEQREVILFLGDELGSSDSTQICRICHDEEEESCSSMESPCACSGSLRFAHRGCLQRWCDEKGSTVCEICLQRYEPGYTVTPQRLVVDAGVSNRRSTVASLQDRQPLQSEFVLNYGSSSDHGTSYVTRSSAAKEALYCRFIYLILAIILMARHLISILSIRAQLQGQAIFIVLVLRAIGVIFPIFIIMEVTVVVIQSLKSKE